MWGTVIHNIRQRLNSKFSDWTGGELMAAVAAAEQKNHRIIAPELS